MLSILGFDEGDIKGISVYVKLSVGLAVGLGLEEGDIKGISVYVELSEGLAVGQGNSLVVELSVRDARYLLKVEDDDQPLFLKTTTIPTMIPMIIPQTMETVSWEAFLNGVGFAFGPSFSPCSSTIWFSSSFLTSSMI